MIKVCLILLGLVHALTAITSDEWVKAHNDARAGVDATDMAAVVWNADLAQLAQAFIDKCVFAHSSQADRSNVGPFSYVGENLYMSSSSTYTAQDVINSWMSEKPYYTYDTGACVEGEMCGHYTQVAWANTCAIGCATKTCSGQGTMAVCNYGEGGNWQGEKPWKIGGSKCSVCSGGTCNTQGLCAKTDAKCQASGGGGGGGTTTGGGGGTTAAPATTTTAAPIAQSDELACIDMWPSSYCAYDSTKAKCDTDYAVKGYCTKTCGKCGDDSCKNTKSLDYCKSMHSWCWSESAATSTCPTVKAVIAACPRTCAKCPGV